MCKSWAQDISTLLELQGLVNFTTMAKYRNSSKKHESMESSRHEKSESNKASKNFEAMEYAMHGKNRGKGYKGYKGKGGCSC